MKAKDLILKYEILHLIRQDKNVGIIIYAFGLPLVSYIVYWLTKSSDSTLGLCFLSICFLNLFYSQRQFIVDQPYYEGFFSKGLNFKFLIQGKLLLLQLSNFIFFLLLIPHFFISFNLERILLLSTFCAYCIGFASPLSLWLSVCNYKYYYNSFNTNYSSDQRYKVTLSQLFKGILPFFPEVVIIMVFSSMSIYIIILNISLTAIGLLFVTKIVNRADNIILSFRHML